MRLFVIVLAALALLTVGFATQEAGLKGQTQTTQKKQLTEEQKKAQEQKRAARKQGVRTEEQKKALEQKQALRKKQLPEEQKKALGLKRTQKGATQKKQMTEEQKKMLEQKRALKGTAQKLGERKQQGGAVMLTTREQVEKVLSGAPRVAEMQIRYHEIAGLAGQSQWHIGDTQWWVRLHGGIAGAIELDKTKTYKVTGIVLEQNYGVVEVWVKSIGTVD